MSNPEDSTPTGPAPDAAGPADPATPTDAPPAEPTPPAPSTPAAPPADAQPTEAYPPSDAQPNAAYAPAGPDAQSTEAYPPAQPTEAYPPAYGAPAVAAPPAPPAGPDTRPKTFGWLSLGLAVGGLLLVLLAFIPLVWVSLVLALIGGVLLLVGLILGIVTLANKKQGGKGLGIGAIVVSVLGGGAWIGALAWALVLIGLSTAGDAAVDEMMQSPVPSASATASEPAPEDSSEPAPSATEGAPEASGDQAAYLAEVRPQLLALFQEVEPSITESEISLAFTDETLVSMGEGMLAVGDAGRDAMIEGLSQSTGGAFSAEQAGRFYDIIYSAAATHLG